MRVPSATDDMTRTLSATEVAAHNRPDDCWVIVHGVVYDVTSFLPSHPGGPMLLLPWAGADATVPFEETRHSQQARRRLESLRIGVVAGGPADRYAAGGPCLRTATGGLIGLGSTVPRACACCGAALPECSDVCGSCQEPSSAPRAAHHQLQLAGRTLQPGEEVDGMVTGAPDEGGALAPPEPQPMDPEPQSVEELRPADAKQQTPGEWAPSWQGDWQMNCLICGPVCGVSQHRLEPAQALAQAMKNGDTAARMGDWSLALAHYHEAIGSLGKDTAAETVAIVRTAASIAQRKMGSMRSALRHAQLGVAACATDARVHAARGAALEALGLVVDAHAAFVEAARLEPSQSACAEAAGRLLPLRRLLFLGSPGCEEDGPGCEEDGPGCEEAPPLQEAPQQLVKCARPSPPHAHAQLSAAQRQLVDQLRHLISEHELAPHLLPLPTPARVLDDDRFHASAFRGQQLRLMALLSLDAAATSARASPGGHTACAGVRAWLVAKSAELGLDLVGEIVRAALHASDEADESGSDDEEGASEADDEEEGPLASEEVKRRCARLGPLHALGLRSTHPPPPPFTSHRPLRAPLAIHRCSCQGHLAACSSNWSSRHAANGSPSRSSRSTPTTSARYG